MSTATTLRPLSFAGVPLRSWAFGIRIWIAMVVALAAGFWLQLEAPSTAAITVAILAAPTRGPALEKACYRLLATVLGVTAAIVIAGLFSQTRDLMLAGFAAWLGLCVYAAGVLDGNRAYAAVLSGYTVAIVAIEQLDTPHLVFETAVARGAAIVVGVAAVAVVNDLLATPDSHPWLAAQLAAIHRRVRDYAKAVLRDEATDAATPAGLLRDIAALHPELASLATESATGPVRSAAARSTAVALVAEVNAARALDALPVAADPSVRVLMASTLDRGNDEPLAAASWRHDAAAPDSSPALLDWALGELLRRDGEVRDGLAALQSGARPRHAWRTPLHRSHAIAAAAGLRAVIYLALASAVYVLAGWPAAEVSLALVAIVIALGATTPSPQAFTIVALIASPVAAILAGTLEFLVLDGVTAFPLLAIALAPFMIGAAVAATLPHRLVSALGKLNLIFILAMLGPSNPQTYNPEAYLFTTLFVCVATALLLAAQTLIPPVSGERRQRWLVASARRELGHLLSRRDRHLAPEEAMFRDATRIGQILGAGPQPRAVLDGALSCFEAAAAIRLCDAGLARLAGSPLSALGEEARRALSARDAQRIRDAARDLRNAAEDGLAGALLLAGIVLGEPAAGETGP
ncbi:MAG: FUSC family protein [Inquilinus sp.]|uniref:FUSC family protein n=1 Tax=Inquilinus sp. TaxID=1932117 RepID=UPI003F376300